jgi:hypothetical protein
MLSTTAQSVADPYSLGIISVSERLLNTLTHIYSCIIAFVNDENMNEFILYNFRDKLP